MLVIAAYRGYVWVRSRRSLSIKQAILRSPSNAGSGAVIDRQRTDLVEQSETVRHTPMLDDLAVLEPAQIEHRYLHVFAGPG